MSVKQISAQVILKPASGQAIEPTTQITSENVAQFMPSPAAISKATRELRAKGFEVGPCVGNSFSITGPTSLFESVFKHSIQVKEHQVTFTDSGYELPKEKIPALLRQEVSHITFTAPPDFGPGNMSALP